MVIYQCSQPHKHMQMYMSICMKRCIWRIEVLADFLIHNGFYMLGQKISVSFPSLFHSTPHPSFCLTVLNHILLVQNANVIKM